MFLVLRNLLTQDYRGLTPRPFYPRPGVPPLDPNDKLTRLLQGEAVPGLVRDIWGSGYIRVSRAMAKPPLEPAVAGEPSAVLNRVVVTDPQEDLARERARMAEATPIKAQTPDESVQKAGLRLVGSVGTDNPRSSGGGSKRQDFSNEKVSKRDTRLGDYALGQTLGEGEFGKVKMGWKQNGGVQVAIKLIRREKLDSAARLAKVYREISILQQLDHPNIVRLHEMVETERTIGIILEYASGGELFDYILHHRYLKDSAARRLFAQLVSGVGYLHKKGIIHRDLKLENLLLDRNKNIIITDFGFANTFDPNDELDDKVEKNLHRRSFVKKFELEKVQVSGFRRGDLMATSCGSPCYAAPELVVSDGIYTGRKVDVWSCGVILYAMLAGYLPFDDDPANPEGDNINLLYKYIVTTPLVFPEFVTPHARDLLRRILVPDPRKRADLFEVARHSWLSEYSHVVEFITSGTTSPSDIATATFNTDGQYGTPESKLARSSSVRESVKPLPVPSPVSGILSKHGVGEPPDSDEKLRKAKEAKDAKRRTVQLEYVPPQQSTARTQQYTSPAQPAREVDTTLSKSIHNAPKPTTQARTYVENEVPKVPPKDQYPGASRIQTNNKSSMPPPTRPGRDVPRSISDSTAFATGPTGPRPSTGGSMNSTGQRLPSRGSYGQPSAAAVATTNAHAQGRFAQPKPNGTNQYVISSPIAQSATANTDQYAAGSPSTQASSYQPASAVGSVEAKQRGHKRSSTLTSLGEKIFGRSGSIKKSSEQRAKPDRSYPPTSMRPVDTEAAPRQSTDSRRSFGFVRKSSDLAKREKRNSRRFSFIPRLSSSGNTDSSPPSGTATDEASTPNLVQSNPNLYTTNPAPAGYGSSRDTGYRYSSDTARPSTATQKYGSPNFYAQRVAATASPTYAAGSTTEGDAAYGQPAGQQNAYFEEKYGDQYSSVPRQDEQGRVSGLQPSNRRFGDAYEQETGHAGSSGAARKVMDFFRRRGKSRGQYQ